MNSSTKSCKYCRTEIHEAAKVCPACNRHLGHWNWFARSLQVTGLLVALAAVFVAYFQLVEAQQESADAKIALSEAKEALKETQINIQLINETRLNIAFTNAISLSTVWLTCERMSRVDCSLLKTFSLEWSANYVNGVGSFGDVSNDDIKNLNTVCDVSRKMMLTQGPNTTATKILKMKEICKKVREILDRNKD